MNRMTVRRISGWNDWLYLSIHEWIMSAEWMWESWMNRQLNEDNDELSLCDYAKKKATSYSIIREWMPVE